MKKKILVLGSTGFLGRAIYLTLKKNTNYILFKTKSRKNYNLLIKKNMVNLIESSNPDIIVNCLGVVGGIQWGIKNKLKITIENNILNMNLLDSIKSKKIYLINLIANCVYPFKYSLYQERFIFDGPIHPSVFAYGMSRRVLLSSSKILSENKDLRNTNLVLANVYGPGDHFDEYRSHALGGLIKKFYEAKINDLKFVEIWGTGKPKRDWIYIDDVCNAVKVLIKSKNKNLPNTMNVASNNCISINLLAKKMKNIFNYSGKIKFNTKYQDGDPVKKFSTKLIKNTLKWESSVSMDQGLKKTIKYYINNRND